MQVRATPVAAAVHAARRTIAPAVCASRADRLTFGYRGWLRFALAGVCVLAASPIAMVVLFSDSLAITDPLAVRSALFYGLGCVLLGGYCLLSRSECIVDETLRNVTTRWNLPGLACERVHPFSTFHTIRIRRCSRKVGPMTHRYYQMHLRGTDTNDKQVIVHLGTFENRREADKAAYGLGRMLGCRMHFSDSVTL